MEMTDDTLSVVRAGLRVPLMAKAVDSFVGASRLGLCYGMASEKGLRSTFGLAFLDCTKEDVGSTPASPTNKISALRPVHGTRSSNFANLGSCPRSTLDNLQATSIIQP